MSGQITAGSKPPSREPIRALTFLLLILTTACALCQDSTPAIPAEQKVEANPIAPSTNATVRSTQTNRLPGFEVPQGFALEIVAEAPQVTAPVTMAFDESGRLYVAEIPSYLNETSKGEGRIRLLEDSDGDGRFDTSAVFADKINWPAGIACFEGGIFVAATPEILYLKDTRNEGKADVRRTIFTGFGGSNRPVAQALVGSLKWGLDNRIHGITAGIGGDVSSPAAPYLPSVYVGGADFSFDPRTLLLRRETGPTDSAIAFDSRGRKFATDHTRPLRRQMYEERHYLRNPAFSPAPGFIDLLDPALPLFTLMPVQANATTVRTNVSASVPTARARGTVIYRGGAFPTNYFGNAFFADPEARVVHRAILERSGATWTASRDREEAEREFLRSSDPLFRPMQLAEGPEGALYIADFRAGGTEGRIYRLAPEGHAAGKFPDLKTATTDLITGLGNKNGWHREAAMRLLFEREDKTNAPALVARLLTTSASSQVRVQALHVLEGLGSLTDKILILGLKDRDETVRAVAAMLSEHAAPNGAVSDPLWSALRAVAADSSPLVRYHAAFTLGAIQRPDRHQLLGAILRRDFLNPWMQTALLSSLRTGAADLAIRLVQDARLMGEPAPREFTYRVGMIAGLQAGEQDVARVIEFLTNNGNMAPLQAFTLLGPFAEGLEHNGAYISQADANHALVPWFNSALRIVAAAGVSEPLRLQAARVMAASAQPYGETADILLLLLANPSLSQSVRAKVTEALGRYDDPRLGTNVITRWASFPPTIRSDLVTMLASRPERVPALVATIAGGSISPAVLTSDQINMLRNFPESQVSQQAVALFGTGSPQRPAAVKQYEGALKLVGIASQGREIFANRCTPCHGIGNVGARFGPPLDDLKAFSKESILAAILEPNLQIRAGYESWLMQARDGRIMWGVLRRQDPESIILARPGREDSVWPKSRIQFLQAQPWSMMPEGVENGLTLQEMASLIEFLKAGTR